MLIKKISVCLFLICFNLVYSCKMKYYCSYNCNGNLETVIYLSIINHCFALFAVFRQLEQWSMRHGPRPGDGPPLKFSSSDEHTLIHYLNDVNCIEPLNDQFLSRFIFSIREHTNIVNSDLGDEKRVKTLLSTLKLCSEKVFKVFCELCMSVVDRKHMLEKLEKRVEGDSCRQRQKRKPADSGDFFCTVSLSFFSMSVNYKAEE